MILNLVEELSCFFVDDSIRDEALGDLWEADHRLHVQKTPLLWRDLLNLWRFLLIVKASIAIRLDIFKESFQENYADVFKYGNVDHDLDKGEIDLGTLDVLRRYCDFRFIDSRKTTAVQWVSSYLQKTKAIHNSDDRLSQLIKQADRLINQCQSTTGHRGDSESVINSLVLSHFIKRLESNPPTQIDGQTFIELVKGVHLTREFINRYIGFNDETFSRRLIIRTWSLTVYAISWEPGQVVEMHHHGNSLDAIQIIQGKMTHWMLAPEDWEKEIPFEGCHSNERYQGKSQIFSDGEVCLVDRLYGHQIANLSDERLITLHFRFGPPPEDNHWRSTADELNFVWEQIEFVWNQPLQRPIC